MIPAGKLDHCASFPNLLANSNVFIDCKAIAECEEYYICKSEKP
jgi:hypothetical protein